jgi:hypothetical protein
MKENGPFPVLSPELRALAESQRQHHAHPRRRIAKVDPIIPEKNIWGRPMPRCRVRNMRRRHHHLLLEKLIGPLPKAEFARLRSLALGERFAKLEFASRRTPALGGDTGSESLLTDEFFGMPLNKFMPSEQRLNVDPHKITPRYMRRIWMKIWEQTCILTRNAEGIRFEWGGRVENLDDGPQRCVEEYGHLFDGLDAMEVKPNTGRRNVTYGKGNHTRLILTNAAAIQPPGALQ